MILHEAQQFCLIYLLSQAELTNLALNIILLHSSPSPCPYSPVLFYINDVQIWKGQSLYAISAQYIISTFLTVKCSFVP